MFNMQKMMAQVQKFQKQTEEMQKELEGTTLTGAAGGGLVEVQVNGHTKFKNIKIKPEAINPENPASVDEETIEMLEDLVASAIMEATAQAEKVAKEKMERITGGMGMPGGMPGLGALGNMFK